MARTFSVYRRRAGVIDLFINARANIKQYNFKFATNFDGPFVIFESVPVYGKRSLTAPDTGFDDGQFRGKTRFLFNPADYALTDTDPLYFRVTPVFVDTTVGPDEGIQLVLPYSSQPNRPVILRGNAPSAASLAGSLEINLPQQIHNIRFQVLGATAMFVAFEPSGPEYEVFPTTSGLDMTSVYPASDKIYVRGSGAVTEFNMLAALRNNPIM